MYCFTSTDEDHAEETRRLCAQVNARKKKMSLLNDTMMEVLRPLMDFWVCKR